MIKLGISSCFMYPEAGRLVFSEKHLCYLERDMARYLSRKGVLPLLIPDLDAPELEAFLAEMDGFVFQGGTDLAPQTYGEHPIGKWKGDPYRDQYELKILDYAIRHEKPVYGICRGFQLMNVYFGGSLYQDIATQKPDAIPHRDAKAYDQLHHEITFTAGTFFHRLHQEESTNLVNSVHHQGVKQLGKDLEVLAVCLKDEMIEAFQWKKAPDGKVFGVQWHPEFTHNSRTPLINADIIYDHFLTFCKNMTYENH